MNWIWRKREDQLMGKGKKVEHKIICLIEVKIIIIFAILQLIADALKPVQIIVCPTRIQQNLCWFFELVNFVIKLLIQHFLHKNTCYKKWCHFTAYISVYFYNFFCGLIVAISRAHNDLLGAWFQNICLTDCKYFYNLLLGANKTLES